MPNGIFDPLALRDFERARSRAFWRDLVSWVTGMCNEPLRLERVRGSLPAGGQHYLGLQAVSIKKIVGSAGRFRDFDRAFLPRQEHTMERWVRIDEAHIRQQPLPPVDLIKVGQVYFVKDGHHRVSVARARGQEFIDAVVIEIELLAPVDLADEC